MLTPSFALNQTYSDVLLSVTAPMANIAETELSVVDDLVIFYSPPYYLRLHLPGRVVDIEGDTGKYRSDTNSFSFTLKKVSPGEYFEDLDLIGKLLIPPKKYQLKPEIFDVDEEVVPSSDPDSDEEELGFLKQEIIRDSNSDNFEYGFANKGCGLGLQLRDEFREILDIECLENSSAEDCTLMREADEQAKFSDEHYLADFIEHDEIDDIINWTLGMAPTSEEVKFTNEEKELMKYLGNRDYLLDHHEKKIALLSLVDIIFAFAYENRTMSGEMGPESPWTINKLSSTLSWLESFETMKDVKVACARRSLVFPLYRNWDLTITVFRDTFEILKLGRRQILKCLLKIHRMFTSSEPRYLLNQLYITDYCIWIQKISENSIKRLAELFEQVEVTKSDVRLEIVELEDAALIVKQEEEELNIVNRMLDIRLSDREFHEVSESGSEDEDYEEAEGESSSSEWGGSSSEYETDSESFSLDSDDISDEE